ncbi:MAG TPA: protein kinase [Candidatus Limiplasma sp.]|nr:protein kinase [Candidatus Limiplasma sp.]HRX09305.1 protein kinase [Candidatus Limiplasma sp.]
MQIGEYTCQTPFVTAGSGNARWCVAGKKHKQYFLKEFLAPVQPVQTTQTPTRQVSLRRKRCAAFENRKLHLYEALKRVPENYVVHVDDFFVHGGHYYAASAYLGANYRTLESFKPDDLQTKLKLLLSLSQSLSALHTVGIVHADLKPEHIIIDGNPYAPRVRLIDFDSSFAELAPPEAGNELAIDPVYMSPEAYRLITGKNVRLNRKADTFAFGILMHQVLVGSLPGFKKESYSYPYAAVLNGTMLDVSKTIDPTLQTLIHKTLKKHPAFRPGDKAMIRDLKAMLR